MDKPLEAELPVGSDTEIMPLIIIEDSLVVEKPKTTDRLLPIGSEILLPRSPEMTSFEDPVSAPLSPNRVREGHSQDTVQITFIFIDFRVCDFVFAFKTQNAPCVSRFKRVLFSDRFQFAF